MAKVVPLKPVPSVNASQNLFPSMPHIMKSNGEVNHEGDDSLIDLDYEKNLTTIDTEKMLQAKKQNHATRADGEYYKCADVCCDFEPGSHYCISSSEKSDLTKFGVGILLYFKYLKHLMFFFFLFILLSVPALVFSVASYQTYNTNSGSTSYLDLLTATTIGSIGLGAASCGLGKLSAYATAGSTENQITFTCTAGEIADVSNIIYGIVETGSTCNFFEPSDLYTACNEYDSATLSSTFSGCVGKESCTINIPDGMFKTSTACQNYYKAEYVYIQVSCDTTKLTLFEGIEIEKTTVAYTVAILDTIIIVVFLIMVYSMRYAQRSAAKNVLKKAYSASSYTVQIRNLPQDMPSEELAAKLWTFLDHKLGNKQSYTNHRVVDVQIVLPNRLIAFSRMFGDIIRKKNTLMREFVQLYAPGYSGKQIDYAGIKNLLLQLKERQSPMYREATSIFKKIQEKADQKKKMLLSIQKLRASKDIRIVCAFVTFSSVPARNRILDKFSSSSFDRFARILCSCCYTKDLSFHGKLIYAKSAEDPGSILWENLGEPGPIIFLRRMGSFILTVAMWAISGAILLVSTYYKNYFKSEYPTIDCTGRDPTEAEVAADYKTGSLQLGLLECYCTKDIIGRLSDVFTDANNEKLCQTWLKDKFTMLSITFAIVFGVIIINFVIQFIFQGLSKFEKHSTLNKQLSQRVLKVFVAQFLNTGILILLINAKIKEISFWQGKFTDISPLWYENVGSTLLSTMFINIFTIPAIKLVLVLLDKLKACCDRGCTQDIRKTKKKTQPGYEKLYMGPEFIIDFRYSQVIFYHLIIAHKIDFDIDICVFLVFWRNAFLIRYQFHPINRHLLFRQALLIENLQITKEL